jgi:hypothetical protein
MGALFQDFTVDAKTKAILFLVRGGDATVRWHRGPEIVRETLGRKGHEPRNSPDSHCSYRRAPLTPRAADPAVRASAVPLEQLEQFEAAVGGEPLRRELDRQIAIDHLLQGAYAQAHQRDLQCLGSNVGAFSLLITQEALLTHAESNIPSPLFSDWG